MTPTERFAALVSGPEDEIPLDEAAFLVAAHARPDLDIDGELSRLDDLASACREPTLETLLGLLFEELGFRGNADDYHDPRNSFLDEVVTRRTGIPITLSVVVMEVGRRLGLPLRGVGMPGHFLVHHDGAPPVYVDAFDGGRMLDTEGCAARFTQLYPGVSFDPRFLQPVGSLAIVGRILANLKAVYAAQEDAASLAWVLRLRVAIPGIPAEERVELSRALAGSGRFADAADVLDAVGTLVPEQASTLAAEATALRARLN